ncbi:response regulator receiver and ANTAR domain protein [Pelagimonas varians]|uniref:Putative transcriptional regulatory protein pdtaR n=2 Tax=Pelagimonas varians TaxID=696760 RepID=A0A238K1Y6_9RHOB|nr:response regulator receiver and ANTAR domain protein [Pelagimonas varians]SMX36384.1 putative transcriptional regulatory protein pdtaR [Pelagimonas varians]
MLRCSFTSARETGVCEIMPSQLSIVVVEADRDRALQIVDSLRTAGEYEIRVISEPTGLARQIQQHNPDMVLIDIENPSRDMLEELTLASGPKERAVAMFVDRSAAGLSAAAIEAGVSAYVVGGMMPERITPVLEAAIARFRLFQRMRTELAETKRALEDRKVIDRAKGMIMKARGVNEEQAYALLRKAAMDQNRRLAEVAQALVSSAGLLL